MPDRRSPAEGDRTSSDVRIEGVTKRFGGFTAVDDLTLTIPAGSFFALLGPSGCGKTTTLRMVAGLEQPTGGRILLGEDDVTDLRPYKRPVNTVFQSYALFPHLSIAENVAFGLRRRGVKDVGRQVDEMLELVELGGFGRRRPGQLSGGQQQRVALARALINRPRVLLLDEPLGALDLKLRRQMQLELKRIQTEVGITFVHVTHDQEEAMTMADTIAVMNAGRVEQLGGPEQLYERPASRYVANFLGQSNCLDGVVDEVGGDGTLVTVQGCRLRIPGRYGSPGARLSLGVRPEKTVAVPAGEAPGAALGNQVPGTVTDVSFTGLSTQYLVRTPWGQEISVFAQNAGGERRVAAGEQITVVWRPEHTFPLDAAPTEVAEQSGASVLAEARS
ncbi:ABC transporter ATP-binding protein [Blastococcus sp. BMG 814]|uniref:Spermidine/putrescine import ATP-binding protein PotA n=1 Tax=Blastococcus carthaginiensis TaxID=3050034 RepID=A0ABT9IBL3_9ACTN|nr:ABC transporter ATP-binding protein [Blastococcus carthaginiensis]MDP5182960.1 ABC transporter ATP-binding protein [Blastococcus carthaginiensis]